MLRTEVETLLASDGEGWELIEKPALEVAAPLLAHERQQLSAGQSFSHYRVISLIGKGGMGEVYLAEDRLLNRRIALKLLPADYTRDKERLRRFEQEAQAASALNHPNILTIHEIGHAETQRFIATEFVDGETLRQRLTHKPLTLPDILEISIQIANALAAAHQAGIVHRDIKPENIMLRRDGYVKVLDFGLAKLTEQHEPTPQAQIAEKADISSGLVMGTVKYMSPEQARGLSVDARSDIFSFGVVLYEMITGRAPFNAEAVNHIVTSILNDEPPPLTEHFPDAPEDLKRIIGNALSKDKAKRYQTAEELLVDLRNLRQQIEPGAGFQTSIRKSDGRAVSTEDQRVERTSTIEYFVSQIREHKPIAAAGLIGLLILLGGVGYPLRKWISKRAVPAKELKTTLLTTTGHVMEPAISPDGKYVAYRTEEAGLFSLRVRELATNNETQMTPPEDRAVLNPVFSPDGKYLYYEFIADDPPLDFTRFTRQLYRRRVWGGAAEKIVDYLHSKVTFSPDGNELAFIRRSERGVVGTVVIANVDGTGERSIIARKAPNYFPEALGELLSWAPDGKHLAYAAVNAGESYARIFEVDLETNLEKPLTTQEWDHGIGNVTWLPDSSGILFGAATTSMSNALWRLSYPGGELQRITNDANKYYGLSVAGDSNTLVTIQVTDYLELWLAPDADASRARRIMPGRHDGNYGFAWTPDGKIVFTRETSGNSDIWIANADGTNQKQLTTNAHQNVSPTVTNDGRYIVLQSNRSGADHIWRMDIDGGNQKQLTFGPVERAPGCSPDSKWVVYHGWETGKPAPWKISIEGDAPVQIADVLCFRPRVSHDGKLIACGTGAGQVLIFSFEGGHPVASVELPKGAMWDGSWTLDDRAIRYVISNRTQNYQIYGTANWWIQPIAGGPPKQLTFFKPDQLGATSRMEAAWSPDGKGLLYTHYEFRSD
ncbi:MAG TPA: protein kinase, partial [Blastocatellia bacterium]|nr:protein kinase [Blastocatellia bacterium]